MFHNVIAPRVYASAYYMAPNGGGTLSPSAGRITTLLGDAHRIQFAVKMLF